MPVEHRTTRKDENFELREVLLFNVIRVNSRIITTNCVTISMVIMLLVYARKQTS